MNIYKSIIKSIKENEYKIDNIFEKISESIDKIPISQDEVNSISNLMLERIICYENYHFYIKIIYLVTHKFPMNSNVFTHFLDRKINRHLYNNYNLYIYYKIVHNMEIHNAINEEHYVILGMEHHINNYIRSGNIEERLKNISKGSITISDIGDILDRHIINARLYALDKSCYDEINNILEKYNFNINYFLCRNNPSYHQIFPEIYIFESINKFTIIINDNIRYTISGISDNTLINELNNFLTFYRYFNYKLKSIDFIEIVKYITNKFLIKCDFWMKNMPVTEQFAITAIDSFKKLGIVFNLDLLFDFMKNTCAKTHIIFNPIITECTRNIKHITFSQLKHFNTIWRSDKSRNIKNVWYMIQNFANFESLTYEKTQEAFEYVVFYDLVNLIDIYKEDPEIKLNKKLMTYACNNGNYDLVIYLLNNKLLPSEDDLFSFCNYDKADELLQIISNFGIKISDDIFRYRLLSNPYAKLNIDKKYKDSLKYNKIKKRLSKNTTDKMEILRHMFLVEDDWIKIENYIELNNLTVDDKCLDNIMLNNETMIYYAIKKYKFIPSLSAITRIKDVNVRMKLMMRFYQTDEKFLRNTYDKNIAEEHRVEINNNIENNSVKTNKILKNKCDKKPTKIIKKSKNNYKDEELIDFSE